MKRPPDEQMGLLLSIEGNITSLYARYPDLADFQVDRVFEGLSRTLIARKNGKEPRPLKLDPVEQELYDLLETTCTIFTDNISIEEVDLKADSITLGLHEQGIISHDQVIAGIKRLRKSLKLWTKTGGRQGYLNYISQFL